MYTQDYIDNLPVMHFADVQKIKKAERKAMGLKHFKATKACGKCATYVKVCIDHQNGIQCANCVGCFKGMGLKLETKERTVRPAPKTDKEFSVGTMKFTQSYHNQQVVRLEKENWKLPSAFNATIK